MSKKIVTEKLEKYYQKEISKFTDDFTYEIYFYNKENGSMCVEDNCNAVEISFSASLIYSYQYHRTITYEVYKTIDEP